MASPSDVRLEQVELEGTHPTSSPVTPAHCGSGDAGAMIASNFTSVSLTDQTPPKKKKQPRRILHFSDGVLEEYSTDDEPEVTEPLPLPVNTKELNWGPWFWYKIVTAATTVLGYADFCGEKLAWTFGITSPKYQSAIDEFHRMKAEEDEERREMEKTDVYVQGQQLSHTEEGIPNVSIRPGPATELSEMNTDSAHKY